MNGAMRVKSAPGSAAAKRSHTEAITRPIGAGRALLLDGPEVEPHVLVHQRVGEAGGVAAGEHVVRGTCRSWPRSGRSTRPAPRSSCAGSRPTERPKASASLVAASAVADRKLLASFSAWASPGRSPTRLRRSLRPASTGSTWAQARVVPGVHDGEGAGPGSGHAARHRCVDVADCRRRRAGPAIARAAAHADGRGVDDMGGPPVGGGRRSPPPPAPTRPRRAG